MQQGNRNPMDERNETPREQDTHRERIPNRRPDVDYSGKEEDRAIDIDKTPGEQKTVRSEPMEH